MLPRSWIKRIAKFAPLLFLLIPIFSAAQAIRETPGGIIDMDGESFPPEDPHEHAEWTFARFHYDMGYGGFGRFRFQRWAADYPKSDRQFVIGVKRLTRIDARSKEHVIDAKSDEIYDYPWLYAEDPGAWDLSPEQVKYLREYLLRGGFLMLDDSHGSQEWDALVAGMKEVFPEYSIEDLPNNDELFHIVYDLDDRIQIDGTRYIWGRMRYTHDSATAQWRGIRDDKGRLLVAICHNSDVGDAWEWADSPNYPEHQAALAYQIGVNYIIYGMTH